MRLTSHDAIKSLHLEKPVGNVDLGDDSFPQPRVEIRASHDFGICPDTRSTEQRGE